MKILFSLFFLLNSYMYADKTELGIGLGALSYPDYIGSKSTNTLVAPIPYVRFSHPYLNINEDGLTSKLFGINNLTLNLSVGGSLPANSEDNILRQDMPDLDFTLEIGPNLIYKVYHKDSSSIELQLPIRATLSTDLTNLKYQGITSNPRIKYKYKKSGLELILSTGLIFSNQKYNAYFYAVDKEYVTPKRDEYSASAGYGGFKTKIGMTYHKNLWVFGAFVSHYSINNTSFIDSPLVETNSALYFGTSIWYLFYTSD